MVLRRFILFGMLFALLVSFGAYDASTAHAGPIRLVVKSLADTISACSSTGIGNCTLRDAIRFANGDGQEQNIINFGVTGTIKLQSNLPVLFHTLTIDSSGQLVTISGEDSFRVFTTDIDATITLNALTLSNGAGIADCDVSDTCGGALKNEGNLTLNNSIISNNSADFGGGGIWNQGTLAVNDTTFQKNCWEAETAALGGAIYNAGALTVDGSTFSKNSSYNGSAIYNQVGDVTIRNHSTFSDNQVNQSGLNTGSVIFNQSGSVYITTSTFSKNLMTTFGYGGALRNQANMTVDRTTFAGNQAEYGGAVYNEGTGAVLVLNGSTLSGNSGRLGGGGVYNDHGTVTIINSTVTGNFARGGNGGGLYNLDGTMNVTNSTIWQNTAYPSVYDSGGIYNDGNGMILRNTIVSDNTEYQCYDYAESMTADSHNLSDDSSCGNATTKTVAQISLGSLYGYGGPTQTLKPNPNSAALNAGDNAFCPPTDQRGVKRPQGATCDIGSVEVRVK